ncbi:hypothetical protein D9K04_04755 [Escherichia coli]|nr:hypothetical protein [Escherichia coli]ELU2249446.1 hypothetical protein [Escherichia coli]MIC27986.1 hypothetical protein [Escherichia coli]HEI2187172.1 hypothetical protein [Escherichia coli]
MTHKEYIRQLAQEIINMNKPMINRIVTAEVDKIKAQLASLAPNAADRRKMLAVMGSNSALGVYLAKTDELAGFKSDIATETNKAPDARQYFEGELDDFTRQYFDGDDETNKRISEYFDGDPVFNAAIDEYFNGPKEFRDQLDDYFYMGE